MGNLAWSGELLESKSSSSLASLNSFQQLTQNLNQIAQRNQVSFKIPPIAQELPKMSRPQLFEAKASQLKPSNELPALSVDKTRVSSQELNQLGFDSYGNLNSLIETAQDTLKSEGFLNLPKARVLDPSVGEKWNNKQALDSPPRKEVEAENADVLTALSPKNTRFGKDRYDNNPFQGKPESQASSIPNWNNAGDSSASSQTLAPLPVEITESKDKEEDEDPEVKRQREARENFEKTMKEFAERTEDKEAFQLVDYYDLRNVLFKNENLLGSFENDDIDERFIKNAKTIFDRFGEKDSSSERRSFEKFLKRVQPQASVFGNPLLRKQQNGIGRRPEVHQ